MTKITILGGGSFGTALAVMSSHNDNQVTIYCRDIKQVESINKQRRNSKRFSDVILPENITATSNLQQAVSETNIIIHCIPSQHTYQFINDNYKIFPKGVPYISTCKGIYKKNNSLIFDVIKDAMHGRTSNIINENICSRPEIPLGILSGPSFAKEIISKHPISVVVASKDNWCCKYVQKILSSEYFRIYITDDVIGVGIGGALKNPIAIGAGIARGLGYGQSSIAYLVTRGCMEIKQIAIAMGGREETVNGLSGIGDLMLTCYSSLSRNNKFGEYIASGMNPNDAIDKIGEVVEGYSTIQEIKLLSKKYNLNLPIFFMISEILNCRIDSKTAFKNLMTLRLTEERFIN